MNTKKTTPCLGCIMLFFIFSLTLNLVACRQIEVPAIREGRSIDIKVGNIERITAPNFEFSFVRERKVLEEDNKTFGAFEGCRENKPEVNFYLSDEVQFLGRPSRPIVIYKIEDIKYSQFLLDIYFENSFIFLLFEDGMAAVVKIDENKEIIESNVFAIAGLLPNTRLEQGYFVKLDGNLYFVNNEFIVQMTSDSAFVLHGYQSHPNFETAVAIEDRFIGVAFEKEGVFIYRIVNGSVEIVFTVTAKEIVDDSNIVLSDLVYYPSQKSLIILDENIGIISLRLELGDSSINVSKGNLQIQRELCEMMYLYENSLYVVCGEISRISLSDWPKIEEKNLPHPNIKIRDIYAKGPIVAFIGRNIFRLMYLDRLVNYYQSEVMDKLIFSDDLFISANEAGLFLGNFEVIQPYVTCQAHDASETGSHHLVFKTVAECNEDFFDEKNIDTGTIEGFTSEDSCIYTVYQEIYFWRAGEIKIKPILILMFVVLAIGVGVFLVWLLKRISIKNAREELAEFTTMMTGGDPSEKHKELIEEEVEENSNKSSASHKNEDEDIADQKPSEFELQNHDIE